MSYSKITPKRRKTTEHEDSFYNGNNGTRWCVFGEAFVGKKYIVYGAYRRTSSENFWRLDYLGLTQHPNLNLVEFDLTDASSAIRMLDSVEPIEVYNLAAQSFVAVSFEQPLTTSKISALGVTNLLEAVRIVNKDIRFYQASTSEMFGKVQAIPQNESTPFYPRSPYAVAKLYAHWMTVNYRESYDIFASNGILFNHESPLRGLEFVTRKITDAVAKIKFGTLEVLQLGNLDAKRDWGFAGDYVEGMHKMLQVDDPDTFVLATNKTTTVREFVRLAFKAIDVDLGFRGTNENEVGFCKSSGRVLVKVNPKYFRPTEVDLLIGDASKAHATLGWKPTMDLQNLCREMVEADILRNANGSKF